MSLIEVLAEFDNADKKNFNVYDFRRALNKTVSDGEDVPFELMAEAIAFELEESPRDEESAWGKWFRPSSVKTFQDGTRIEYPSLDIINAKVFEYWKKRSSESRNPILKSRYLGLVLEFQEKIDGSKPAYTVKKEYISTLIDAATTGYCNIAMLRFKKLERALTFALSISDDALIETCKLAIRQVEKECSVDNKPGLWGHEFDLLIGNKKIKLSGDEEGTIIGELEAKLQRLTKPNDPEVKIDPWAAEAAAKRLADYYRKQGKTSEVKRVIVEIGQAFQHIEEGSATIQVSGWLEHVHRLYVKYGLTPEAENVLLRIREIGPKAADEMMELSQSVNIPEEKIKQLKADLTDGSLDETIGKAIGFFIPLQKRAQEQLAELSKAPSLLFMFGQQLQDEKGRVVATVGPLSEDLEGHIVLRITSTMQFQAIFLRIVLAELIEQKGLNTAWIISRLGEHSGFEKDRLEIMSRGLDAYFSGDHLVAMHLMIPQIEQAIRNLVEWSGGNVLKPAKGGGSFQLRTFDDILRHEIVEQAFGADIAHYLPIVFTDQRGWNLRNDILHGMCSIWFFNQMTSDRVFHVVLLLCMLVEDNTR